ncbi:MAG: DPP IV N-terminal domain-containing protein [Phycisphaerales bacterium]
MKTRSAIVLACVPFALVLASCAGSSNSASQASMQTEPAPRRIINPFGSSNALASAPSTPPKTELNSDGSRAGISAAPAYDIFGTTPQTQMAGVDEATTFESTENVRRITSSDEGADFDPALSPDGKWVYFASTRHRATSDIYAKRVDGTAITLLTSDASNDVMPAVSPDGRRLAFASNRAGSYDIYVMSVTGGQPVQITSDPGQELKPTWSPDGKSLAFCRVADGRGGVGRAADRWEVWVSEVNRPSSTRFLTFGLFPTWQPGGNKIAFQRARERGSRYFSVWTIDYTEGEALNPTEVVSSPVAACINPTWSPGGEFIAFSTVISPESASTGTVAPAPGRLSPSQADLWIVRADGSSRAPLTAGATSNLSPTWGPGGRVFFVSNRAGVDNLWSIGAEQALMAMGETDGAPVMKAQRRTPEIRELEPEPMAPMAEQPAEPQAATAEGGEGESSEPQ